MKYALIIVIGLLLAIQVVQIDQTNPHSDANLSIKMPPDIEDIFQKGCYDCHSNHTKWPWYASVAPISWTIASHVKDARASVNYSIWNTYDQAKQQKLLKETFRAVYAAMPLPSYIAFHEEANLTQEERKKVRDWIISLGVDPHN